MAPYYVVGFASSHTSFGWVAQSLLREFAEAGKAPRTIDLSRQFGTRTVETSDEDAIIESGPGTLVFCINPDQIGYALSALGPQALAEKYVIGVFVWELEKIPSSWHAPLALMDALRLPTHFVANAFLSSGFEGPIAIEPYRIDAPQNLVADRARFGLPQNRFLVLAAANLRSGLARKNIDGVMDAFELAFRQDETACLVLKLHDGHLAPEERSRVVSRAAAMGAAVIEEDLDHVTMWTLVETCDAVVSMHRAEGYGLLLKQGLLLGKPVIATGWSGNLDFMADDPKAHLVDFKLVPVVDPQGLYETDGAALVWADPDPASAARLLRKVYAEYRSAAACADPSGQRRALDSAPGRPVGEGEYRTARLADEACDGT